MRSIVFFRLLTVNLLYTLSIHIQYDTLLYYIMLSNGYGLQRFSAFLKIYFQILYACLHLLKCFFFLLKCQVPRETVYSNFIFQYINALNSHPYIGGYKLILESSGID